MNHREESGSGTSGSFTETSFTTHTYGYSGSAGLDTTSYTSAGTFSLPNERGPNLTSTVPPVLLPNQGPLLYHTVQLHTTVELPLVLHDPALSGLAFLLIPS